MVDSANPGWYHAQGDPAGTERYWDGSAWTEGPRPVGGVPSPPSAPAAPTESPALGDALAADPTPSAAPTDSPIFGDAPTAATPQPIGGPVPGAPPAQGPPTFPGAPPSGAAAVGIPGAAIFAEKSNATTALVLAIVGIFCFITAPIGVFMGFKEKAAIDEGRRDPANRGKAIAAIVIGLLITVGSLLIIALAVVIGAVASV